MTTRADLYAADLHGASWRKSSYTANAGNCVEIADLPGVAGIAVRDSKNTDIPAARVTTKAWAQFVTAVAHVLGVPQRDDSVDERDLQAVGAAAAQGALGPGGVGEVGLDDHE